MSNKDKIRNQMFDLLKFLSAILLILHHFQMEMGGTKLKYVNFFDGAFYVGFLVELYFIISGFLMYQYIIKIQNGLTFSKFFIRRFMRYTPLVILSVILFNIFAVVGNQIVGYPGSIESNLFTSILTSLSIQAGWCFDFDLCGYTNYALWYISALQLCYIIFYFLVYISDRFKLNCKYLFCLMIVLGICFRNYSLSVPLVNYKLCRGYYSFFFGLLFADIVKQYSFCNKKLRYLSITIILIGIFVWMKKRDVLGYIGFNGYFVYYLTFLFYPAIIYFLSSLHYVRQYVDNSKFIKLLGDVSFSIYIFHVPLIYLYVLIYYGIFGQRPEISALQMILFSMFVICISNLIHYILEKPINFLINKKILTSY